MPISGQTSLSTIASAKELEESFQPLLLAEFLFLDGSFLRIASENLTASSQFGGKDWLPRMKEHSLSEISSVSNNGIVQSPTVRVVIADGGGLDNTAKDILLSYEWADNRGFKGARLTIYFVYWEAGTGVFSSDSRVPFVGICDAPSFDATTLTVTATNLLNMTRRNLPVSRCQANCGWVFPTTHAQRVQGAINPDSASWQCGYSPDVTDADGAGGSAAARGNLDGSGQIFTYCTYDWQACIDRLGNVNLPDHAPGGHPVKIEQDQAGRATARFGGVHWAPPLDWRGVAYISGTKAEGINNANYSKINDYYPMIYGINFVQPVVQNVEGDPNSTRFECTLCLGQICNDPSQATPIQAVLVNGEVIPFHTATSDLINRWYWVATGNRSGSTSKDAIFNGSGDPYGSLATIEVIVPSSVQASNAIPDVRVLTYGAAIRVWNSSSPTDYTEVAGVTNPIWVLADILTWANWTIADFNLQAFINEAAYCNQSISYTKLDGTTAGHERFRCGLVYRNIRSAADCLTAFLASFRCLLRLNNATGLLEPCIQKTLADQQPSAIAGSNNQSAIASETASGTAASGYLAYDFNESNILWDTSANTTTLKFSQRPISDTPNRIAINFQDEEQNYVTDSLALSDSDDIERTGQEINGNTAAEGIVNYDQANRIIQYIFNRNYCGHPGILTGAKDTRGTVIADWQTTSKVIDLRCGDIVRIAMAIYGITGQLFRVTAINATANYDLVTISADWHRDAWYSEAAFIAQPPSTTAAPTGAFGVFFQSGTSESQSITLSTLSGTVTYSLTASGTQTILFYPPLYVNSSSTITYHGATEESTHTLNIPSIPLVLASIHFYSTDSPPSYVALSGFCATANLTGVSPGQSESTGLPVTPIGEVTILSRASYATLTFSLTGSQVVSDLPVLAAVPDGVSVTIDDVGTLTTDAPSISTSGTMSSFNISAASGLPESGGLSVYVLVTFHQ